ncbi:MAG: type II toxin-antitoxin system VapC family toxin [Chloroflexota bacterium]
MSASDTMPPDSALRAVVPDTSVVLKWYLHRDEPEREQALTLRRAYLKATLRLMVPDLLFYEVANVLRYKPGWDSARVSQAVASLFALKLDIVPVTDGLLQRAVALAFDHDIAVYDAAFVALAQDVGAHYVTADRKLARKLAKFGTIHSLTTLPLNGLGAD